MMEKLAEEVLLQSYVTSYKSLDKEYRRIVHRWKFWRSLAQFVGVILFAVGIITTLDELLSVFDVGLGNLFSAIGPIAKIPIGLVLFGVGYWVSTRMSKLFQSKLIDRARHVLDNLLFIHAVITVHKMATAVEAEACCPWPHNGMTLEELVDVMADASRWMLAREQAGYVARSVPATLTTEKQLTLCEILDKLILGRGLRLSSAIILAQCGNEAGLPLLGQTLQAIQERVIRAPVQLLYELEESKRVTQFVQYFHMTDRDDGLHENFILNRIVWKVLDALGCVKCESATLVLLQYLEAETKFMERRIALRALVRQGTSAAMDALAQLFLTSAGQDREILRELDTIDSPEAMTMLLEVLNARSGQINAISILQRLVRSQQPLVADQLLEYLKSQESSIAHTYLNLELSAKTDTSYKVLSRLVTDDGFDTDLRWEALERLVRYAKTIPVETALQLWHKTPKTGGIGDKKYYDVMAQINNEQARTVLIELLEHADQDLHSAIWTVIGLAHAGVNGWHILEQLGAAPATHQMVRVLANAALLAQNHPSGQRDFVLSFFRDSNIPEMQRFDVLEVFDHAHSLSSVSGSITMYELIALDNEAPTPIKRAAARAARDLSRLLVLVPEVRAGLCQSAAPSAPSTWRQVAY